MPQETCAIIALHPWEIPWYKDPKHPSRADFIRRLQTQLHHLLTHESLRHFSLLMDEGPALDAAQYLLVQQRKFPVALHCLVPFETQHEGWSEAERDRYFFILQHCQDLTLLQHHFSVDCYRQGAQKLLSACHLMLVLWNGAHGDAEDAIAMGRKKAIPMRLLNTKNI